MVSTTKGRSNRLTFSFLFYVFHTNEFEFVCEENGKNEWFVSLMVVNGKTIHLLAWIYSERVFVCVRGR